MPIKTLKPSKYLTNAPADTTHCPHCNAPLRSFFGRLWKCPRCPRIFKLSEPQHDSA